jgi:hypothetical protein
MNTRLKDGGVYIDWAALTDIRVWIYSDAQKSLAGRVDVTIDPEDTTKALCIYGGTKAQYPGINRLIVQARYNGDLKTYDKPVFVFVPRTAEATGNVTIQDPETDVEIVVQDVSSSILDTTILAALSAADRANAAAAAAEHMTDIHQGPAGPAGKSPYIGENGHWYEWDAETEQYVDTETEAQGDTPDFSIGTVTTAEPGTPAAATITGTPEAPILNLTIPKGVAGATPNFTVGEVTTGQPGTPVVVTITGTAAAPVLNIQIPQGMQGNTGSSVDYPYELVNNLTTNDATKGLTAAQGKVLKDELSQLEAIVHNMSGKFYEPVTSSSELPEGDEVGYTFVGATAPFAVWYFDGEDWSDTGMVVDAIEGKPGVGLDDVTTPTPADGTVVMHLSNGNTVTLNLNHNHPQYAKVVVCEDLAEYNAISQKDSMTFYLIPEVAMYLGSTLILEQNSTPLPYTPVDYIETDGDAYIDTGIIGAPVKSAEMKVLPAGGASYTILGSRGSTTDGEAKKFQMFRIIYYSADSIYVVGYGYYYSVAGASNPSVTDSVTNETPFIVKGSFKNGAQSVSVKEEGESSFRSNSTTYTKTITSSLNMYIFAANENGTAVHKATSGTRVYYCKIYSDDSYSTLLFNGVPCYYNNEYGLWDKVSNTFFGAVSGSGTITGPSIS